MSVSDEMVRHLILNTDDIRQVDPAHLQMFLGVTEADSDLEDNYLLDEDGSLLYDRALHTGRKFAEYKAAIQIFLLSQQAVRAGLGLRRAHDACDYYLGRLAEADSIEEYPELVSDATELFASFIEHRSTAESLPPHIVRCKKYIDEHLTENFSLDDVAASLGISPNFLSAQFHEYEGVTMKEYVLYLRVEAAKRLLKAPEHPIGCIASTLCFCSQSHFSQVFKKYTGSTPSAYRRAHLE